MTIELIGLLFVKLVKLVIWVGSLFVALVIWVGLLFVKLVIWVAVWFGMSLVIWYCWNLLAGYFHFPTITFFVVLILALALIIFGGKKRGKKSGT
jgi:hypothetical protein